MKVNDAALVREALAFLAIEGTATAGRVRIAWKRKLKEVHPDRGGTKEAAQHATNMRDVLLAWVDAGRPDLEAETHFGSARSPGQPFAWQEVPQPQWAFTWQRCLAIVVVWAITLLLSISTGPLWEYASQPLQRPQLETGLYGLPVCVGMDIFEETKAMLNGKCWSRARPR